MNSYLPQFDEKIELSYILDQSSQIAVKDRQDLDEWDDQTQNN